MPRRKRAHKTTKANKAMPNLNTNFTSTGSKFWAHQQTMSDLRDGKGRPIVTHIMLTDMCNHKCSFCSVATRTGDTLKFADVMEYVGVLLDYGLKAVILSGGGNPLLYRCPVSGAGISDVIMALHDRGLEIGMITNGVKLRQVGSRKTYSTLALDALDALTWMRISMSGLDHKENEVYVPDVDPACTTLGFSYVLHDTYQEPAHVQHGQVSTPHDLIDPANITCVVRGKDRLPQLTSQIADYVDQYRPRYVRLLPNCLEPNLIPERCADLQRMADAINPNVVFVQNKPPKAPNACFLGYVHPVLNSDSWVYPCDSCVLNSTADHKFANPWRVCHMSKVADLYEKPIHSLVDPQKLCPGCVFTKSNELLRNVVEGGSIPTLSTVPEHPNFV